MKLSTKVNFFKTANKLSVYLMFIISALLTATAFLSLGVKAGLFSFSATFSVSFISLFIYKIKINPIYKGFIIITLPILGTFLRLLLEFESGMPRILLIWVGILCLSTVYFSKSLLTYINIILNFLMISFYIINPTIILGDININNALINEFILRLTTFNIIYLILLFITICGEKYINKIEELNIDLENNIKELENNNTELENSYIKIDELYNKLERLIFLVSNKLFSSDLSKKEFFDDLLDVSLNLVPEAQYGSILLQETESKTRFISSFGYDLEELNSLIKDKHNKIIGLKKPKILSHNNESENEYIAANFKRLNKSLVISILSEDQFLGNIGLDMDIKNNEDFSIESQKALKALSNIASAFITFKQYVKIKEKYQDGIIISLVNMLESYDKYTKGHSKNVAEITKKVAKKLMLSEKEVEKAYWAGLIHDIGKMLIPQNILNKPERLTYEEFEVMKKHSEYGYNITKTSSELKEIAKYILHHHEHFDGKGYPNNLIGEEIPLISRIVSLADAYDTMISKRSYKKPYSKDKARFEINKNSNTQFDPKISNIMIKLIDDNQI